LSTIEKRKFPRHFGKRREADAALIAQHSKRSDAGCGFGWLSHIRVS
jgi:hypothetical protein